jgi:transcription elongation factor GreA
MENAVPAQDAAKVTYLTQEAFDRLNSELTGLIDGRAAMAKEIDERRQEGDLRENGGYHAARDEQGRREARIKQLEAMLRNVTIGQAPASVDGYPTTGSVVTIRYEGDDDSEKHLLASREEAKTATIDVISVDSPLGMALLRTKAGDTATYATPKGTEISVVLESFEPYAG